MVDGKERKRKDEGEPGLDIPLGPFVLDSFTAFTTYGVMRVW